MYPKRLFVFVSLAIGGCVKPPVPAPQSAPPVVRPAPPTPLLPADDWSDRKPAPGSWSYARDGRGTLARFGQSGVDAVFTIRCEADTRRIFVSRPGSVRARMTLRSTTSAKMYEAVPTGDPTLYVVAEIAPRDPQLDAMAFSRGRILIGLDGASDLILPIWPEFTRVVEDCRE